MRARQAPLEERPPILPKSPDEAVEAAAATMAGIKPGDPTNPGTICGPVISERQRDRVQSYLDLAITEGGRFACGGGRPADRDAAVRRWRC